MHKKIEGEIRYKLAFAKWNWISKKWDYGKCSNDNFNQMVEDAPEIEELENCCSYCEAFLVISTCSKKCPIIEVEGIGCGAPKSLFAKWADAIEAIYDDCPKANIYKAKRCAKTMFELIKRTKNA